MPRRKVQGPRVRAGCDKKSMAIRRKAFVMAYIANGHNGTQAAITAGFSPNGANGTGVGLLKEPEVAAMLARMEAKALQAADLTIERTLQELARVAYSDPRKMFTSDGAPIPVHEMTDDVAATVAAVDVRTIKGKRSKATTTTNIKLWDKGTALEKAMKHLGLYERDNAQRGDSLKLQVVLVDS